MAEQTSKNESNLLVRAKTKARMESNDWMIQQLSMMKGNKMSQADIEMCKDYLAERGDFKEYGKGATINKLSKGKTASKDRTTLSEEEKQFIREESQESGQGYTYRAKVLFGQQIVLKEKNRTPVKKWVVDNYEIAKKIAERLNRVKGNSENMEKGATIENQYEGKTAKQIWTVWSMNQRRHFLTDHWREIKLKHQETKQETVLSDDLSEYVVMDEFEALPIAITLTLNNHIKEGQYGKGVTVSKDGDKHAYYMKAWKTSDASVMNFDKPDYIKKTSINWDKAQKEQQKLLRKYSAVGVYAKKDDREVSMEFKLEKGGQFTETKPSESKYALYDFARSKEQAEKMLNDLKDGFPIAHKSTSEGGEYNIYVRKGSILAMEKGAVIESDIKIGSKVFVRPEKRKTGEWGTVTHIGEKDARGNTPFDYKNSKGEEFSSMLSQIREVKEEMTSDTEQHILTDVRDFINSYKYGKAKAYRDPDSTNIYSVEFEMPRTSPGERLIVAGEKTGSGQERDEAKSKAIRLCESIQREMKRNVPNLEDISIHSQGAYVTLSAVSDFFMAKAFEKPITNSSKFEHGDLMRDTAFGDTNTKTYKDSVDLYYNEGRYATTQGVSTKYSKFLLVSEDILNQQKDESVHGVSHRTKDKGFQDDGFYQYPNKEIAPVPVLVLQKNAVSQKLYAVPLRNFEAKDHMEFGGNYVANYFLGAIPLFDRVNKSGTDADDIESYNQGEPRYENGKTIKDSKSDWKSSLDDKEIEFLIKAVNKYGTGDHPFVTKENWKNITQTYAEDVIKNKVNVSNLTAGGVNVRNSILNKLK